MARVERLRPDYALCLLLRTIKPKIDLHENPEYQAILSAVRELRRLYTIETLVHDLFVHLPASVMRDNQMIATDVNMINDYLDKWNYLEEETNNG